MAWFSKKAAQESQQAPGFTIRGYEPVGESDITVLAERERAQMAAAIPDGSVAADTLVERLTVGDWAAQREAAVALLRAGDSRAREWFLHLSDDNAGTRLDTAIALGRVVLSRTDAVVTSGENLHAAMQLGVALDTRTDEWVTKAASWYLSRIPPAGAEDQVWIARLTRWNLVRQAELFRAGAPFPEGAGTTLEEFLQQTDQILAELHGAVWPMEDAGASAPAPAAAPTPTAAPAVAPAAETPPAPSHPAVSDKTWTAFSAELTVGRMIDAPASGYEIYLRFADAEQAESFAGRVGSRQGQGYVSTCDPTVIVLADGEAAARFSFTEQQAALDFVDAMVSGTFGTASAKGMTGLGFDAAYTRSVLKAIGAPQALTMGDSFTI